MEPFVISFFEGFVLLCVLLIITLSALNYGFTQGEAHARRSDAHKMAQLKQDCAKAINDLREAEMKEQPTLDDLREVDMLTMQRHIDELNVLMRRYPDWYDYAHKRMYESFKVRA